VDAGPVSGDDGAVTLVRVFETLDPVRGTLTRALLESDGIEVLAKGEGVGPYRTGPVLLFVPEESADRAAELIAASEDGTLALDPDADLPVEEPAD
jgi:hypothetical protein